jgi:hypothetical protein
VDARRTAKSSGNELGFEGPGVACVNNRWPKIAQNAPKPQVHAEILTRFFMQCNNRNGRRKTRDHFGMGGGQTNYCMAITLRWSVIDEIDDAIFKATNAERINNVHDERRLHWVVRWQVRGIRR